MNGLEIIFAVVQLILAVLLVAVVLFQHGKSARFSGNIAGGAETFFGKNKGRSLDAKLGRWTTYIAVAFVVLTLLLNIFEIYMK